MRWFIDSVIILSGSVALCMCQLNVAALQFVIGQNHIAFIWSCVCSCRRLDDIDLKYIVRRKMGPRIDTSAISY